MALRLHSFQYLAACSDSDMVKYLAIAAAIALVIVGTFIYAAVNTLTDDDYWPDW